MNNSIVHFITIQHNYKKVTSVIHNNGFTTSTFPSRLIDCMRYCSKQYPDAYIVWTHESLIEYINYDIIPDLFISNNRMYSYHMAKGTVADERIGYVDWGTFVHVDKTFTYPTWLMSSDIGVISASVLNQYDIHPRHSDNFDFDLCVLAKLNMPNGLFCYSCPNLLSVNIKTNPDNSRHWNTSTLFTFIGACYKKKWVWILLMNMILYEKKLPLWGLLKGLFIKRIKCPKKNITVNLNKGYSLKNKTVDVLIPTIGRKKYLLEFLDDLLRQIQPVQSVIIVEQNPIEGSVSDLSEELVQEKWPFKIVHIFTHQTGACYARNLGLKNIKPEWVFMADDDIRIENDFISKLFTMAERYPSKAYTISCLQKGQVETITMPIQWHTFGSGCSLAHHSLLKNLAYDIRFEFGFGEDADFGMQIRISAQI